MASEAEFINYKDFVESLTEASDFALTDKSVISNNTNGPRSVPQTTTDKLVAQRTLAGNIAPAFDETGETDYLVNQRVVKSGKLYIFTKNHSGIWNAADAREASEDELIDLILSHYLSKENGVVSDAQAPNLIVYDSLIDGEYYDSTGKILKTSSEGFWRTPMFAVDASTSYVGWNGGLTFFDADKNYISSVNLYSTHSFTSPATAAFAGVSANVAKDISYLYKASDAPSGWTKGERLFTKDKIKDFAKEVNELAIPYSVGEQLFDKDGVYTPLKTGQYVAYNTGIASDNASYEWFSLDVVAGDSYVLSGYSGYQIHVAFYSDYPAGVSTNYISGLLVNSKVPFVVPVGAKVMTVSVKISDASTMMVQKGERATSYKPFTRGLGASSILDKSVTKDKLANEYVEKYQGRQLFDKSGVNTPLTTGRYVPYNTGTPTALATYEWFILPVNPAEEYTFSGVTNIHVAFFDADVVNNSHYVSGNVVAVSGTTLTVPAGASFMTVSFATANAGLLMVQKGDAATSYEPFSRGIRTEDYLPNSVTEDKLSENLRNSLNAKKIVTVGSTGCDYTNICTAIRENQSNTIFKLAAETFDVQAAYEEEYGNDFFDNYDGYSGHTDPMYRGLFLGAGCEIVGQPKSKLSFVYTGTENSAVDEYFSVVSTSDDNTIKSVKFELNGHCRYAIHDDYSTITGSTNIVEHCVFEGDTSNIGRPYIGAGLGKSSAMVYRDCLFVSTNVRSIGLHNNSGNAMGRVEIYGCYCGNDVYIFHHGTSTAKTPVMVHDCKMRNLVLMKDAPETYPNENMELFSWNNTVG